MSERNTHYDEPLSFLKEKSNTPDVSRREFIKLSGISGSLLIGLSISPSSRLSAERDVAKTGGESGQLLNAYVQINPDNTIRIYAPNPEIGQGVKTSLPMIVAEELDADWSKVVVENAPIDGTRFGRQFVGGSYTIAGRWDELRGIGAAARHMLLQAAADKWSVDVTELTTISSTVKHTKTNRSASYAKLAEHAARLSVPKISELKLKASSDYRLLGKRITGVDNHSVVTGAKLFGIDQNVPNMLYACYVKCPVIGGKALSANLAEVRALPGVRDVFILDGTADFVYFSVGGTEVASGVAIVADSTWQAIKARKKLKVEWSTENASTDSWTELSASAAKCSGKVGAKIVENKGDVPGAMANAHKTLESFYSSSFLTHAQLEPGNCLASWSEGAVEVWAPTQTPGVAVGELAALLDIPKEKVTVHQIRSGGGFGRRITNEFAREAALISRKVGSPIKLQWTREDDMSFDMFRPAGFYSIKASLDKKGRLTSWDNHIISLSADGKQASSSAGFWPVEFPGAMLRNFRFSQTLLPSKTPTGPWRAPVSNTYAFVEQSFIHELANAVDRDHLEFLIEMLGEPKWIDEGNIRSINTARAIDVIQQVAKRAGWGKTMPNNRALGLSFYFSHAGYVAEIADVSVDSSKNITVNKVWVVADVGQIVNLSGAENQAQGAVIDGLSAMMAQKITMQSGKIDQANFHQYPLLRNGKQPDIDVHFASSNYSPTGLGEPVLPPLAAAVCNAIYSVNGERIRSLPISDLGYGI